MLRCGSLLVGDGRALCLHKRGGGHDDRDGDLNEEPAPGVHVLNSTPTRVGDKPWLWPEAESGEEMAQGYKKFL